MPKEKEPEEGKEWEGDFKVALKSLDLDYTFGGNEKRGERGHLSYQLEEKKQHGTRQGKSNRGKLERRVDPRKKLKLGEEDSSEAMGGKKPARSTCKKLGEKRGLLACTLQRKKDLEPEKKKVLWPPLKKAEKNRQNQTPRICSKHIKEGGGLNFIKDREGGPERGPVLSMPPPPLQKPRGP